MKPRLKRWAHGWDCSWDIRSSLPTVVGNQIVHYSGRTPLEAWSAWMIGEWRYLRVLHPDVLARYFPVE